MILFLKGGAGSGNFDHLGRPGLQGGSAPHTPPPSDAIATKAEAIAYWREHLGGRTFDISIRTGKGVYKVRVQFDADASHAYTRGAKDGEQPDLYDRPRQKDGGRVVDLTRARMMDRLIPTISEPWKVLGQVGSDVLVQYGTLPDGGAYTAALTIKGKGLYSFASAYPRSKEEIAKLLRDYRARPPAGLPGNQFSKSMPSPLWGEGVTGLPIAVPSGHAQTSRSELVAVPRGDCESPPDKYPLAATRYIDVVLTMFKALGAGERWITVRPNGPGTEGHALLIKPAGDGSMGSRH